MNQVKLTKSQEQAIEQQKEFARNIFGENAKFEVWQPEKTDKTILYCFWTIKNMLGGEMERSSSWLIGKRGKITRRTEA